MDIEQRLDRLTGIVESLPATVVEHDDQIAALIKVAQKHQEEMAELPPWPKQIGFGRPTSSGCLLSSAQGASPALCAGQASLLPQPVPPMRPRPEAS